MSSNVTPLEYLSICGRLMLALATAVVAAPLLAMSNDLRAEFSMRMFNLMQEAKDVLHRMERDDP